MDDTHEFVEKLHDTQKKDDKNRQKHDEPANEKLPTKQHGTNK
ncbi:DUF4023 family protein [Paenibacillus monticola]|uniref:DUF4023 domain-containing protein n=1 Tax=Paenibacillus monticola TaxID=2666075 RepID=A0A7X2HBD2_9BACL|nr:DUF4023 family protein [Paenibacillus monticola]MRN56268.1 DUF4023 domain-containing protein [Paenibacillus monticola]